VRAVARKPSSRPTPGRRGRSRSRGRTAWCQFPSSPHPDTRSTTLRWLGRNRLYSARRTRDPMHSLPRVRVSNVRVATAAPTTELLRSPRSTRRQLAPLPERFHDGIKLRTVQDTLQAICRREGALQPTTVTLSRVRQVRYRAAGDQQQRRAGWITVCGRPSLPAYRRGGTIDTIDGRASPGPIVPSPAGVGSSLVSATRRSYSDLDECLTISNTQNVPNR
jgi:hypothetical protein